MTAAATAPMLDAVLGRLGVKGLDAFTIGYTAQATE